MGAAAAASVPQLFSPQDAVIRGTAKHTPWKGRVWSYANYCFHTQQIDPQGSSKIVGPNTRQTYELDGSGDLLGPCYLRTVLPSISTIRGSAGNAIGNVADHFYYVNCVGYAMIREMSLEIGGQQIVRHSGRFMEIYDELSSCPGTRLDECVGRFEKEVQLIQAAKNTQVLLTPLQMWFCRKPHSYIPLLALQLHDVTLKVQYMDVNAWTVNRGDDSASRANLLSNTEANVLAEFVYIDEPQRNSFANDSHTYLIEQVQEDEFSITATAPQSATTTTYVQSRHQLALNHMTKCFLWVVQQQASVDGSTYTRQSVGVKDRFDYCQEFGRESAVEADLRLNNNSLWERESLPAMYFRQLEPARSWRRVPKKNIYCYCVGHNTGDLQVHATIQMSRIDNQHFYIKTADDSPHTMWTWALNYNLLIFTGGMGGSPFTS